MPTLACPQCEKQVTLPYGKHVPCPECDYSLNVIDDGKGDDITYLPDEKKVVTTHYSTSTLEDAPPRSERRYTPSSGGISDSTSSIPRITYRDIGGLDETITELDLLVNGATQYPKVWKHLGENKIRGILLSGPPGCGKTLLAQALATAGNRKWNVVQGSETNGWRVGDSEQNLIREYKKVAPNGILILDEVDAIGQKRENMNNETSHAVIATLLSILDGAKYKDNVTIIATTNQPDLMDPALRRPGRFNLEISIPPPNVEGRKHIFAIHTRSMPRAQDVDLGELAASAHGFTGADIMGVCALMSKELLAHAAKQLEQGMAQDEVISKLFATQQRFLDLIRSTVPSVLREGFVPVSSIRWSKIGGLADVKKKLQQVIEWPVKHAALMQKLNISQPKGMLLFGPPGCGKTLIAKALARESGCNLLAVNGPALVEQRLGNTEAAIRNLFRKARQAAPCIIFFDEID
ncbi:MAG: AAA family ATPase, partial [Candidatus Sungbacteria bacterium]|nr:AAA family ATPase [Candidatus Sungbacteria bacterium]